MLEQTEQPAFPAGRVEQVRALIQKTRRFIEEGLHSASPSVITRFKQLTGVFPWEYREHIASQFEPRQSFENRGIGWEIDHVQPLSTFPWLTVLDSPQELDKMLRRAFCHSNVRPLWSYLNLRRPRGRFDAIYSEGEQAFFAAAEARSQPLDRARLGLADMASARGTLQPAMSCKYCPKSVPPDLVLYHYMMECPLKINGGV